MMRFGKLSLVDVLALTCIGGISVTLLTTSVQRQVNAARSAQCSENLKTIGLGFHNYFSVYNRLPMGSGGTSAGSEKEPTKGNANRLSPWVSILPFVEQQQLWEEIANPFAHNDITFPRMGPAPWLDSNQYPPWGKRPHLYICPIDETASRHTSAGSYLLCYGDTIKYVGEPPDKNDFIDLFARRGMFACQTVVHFRDVFDGLSNTIMVSEGKIGGLSVAKDVEGLPSQPSLCNQAHLNPKSPRWPEGRSAIWADGAFLSSAFQTILPPNSHSCTSEIGPMEGVMTPSSHHLGGVHVLMSDGRVMFASDTIDAGDPSSPTVSIQSSTLRSTPQKFPSPYGIWGALGTKAGSESIANVSKLSEPKRELSPEELKKLESQPLEDWHAAGDRRSIRARLVGMRPDGHVILLTEKGKVIEVGLSLLDSEDAYRAVESSSKLANDKMAALRSQISRALNEWESANLESAIMPGAQRIPQDSIAADELNYFGTVVKAVRDQRMQMLKDILKHLDSNDVKVLNEFDSGEMTIQSRNSRGPIRLKLEAGRWRILSR